MLHRGRLAIDKRGRKATDLLIIATAAATGRTLYRSMTRRRASPHVRVPVG